MHKKILEGILDVCYEDTAIYKDDEALNHLPEQKLTEQLEDFNGKKIKITIEEIANN